LFTLQNPFNGRVYRYLQFYAIPTQIEKESYEAKGIRFLEYVPNNTYIASLPVGLGSA
jgi:hypothetical protein